MSVGSYLFIQGRGYGGYTGGDYDEIKVGDPPEIIGSVTYGDGFVTDPPSLKPPYVTINLSPRFYKTDWVVGDIHLDDCGQLSIRLDRKREK